MTSSGDQHSDRDWLVATHGLLAESQIFQLRILHEEIPTRVGHWCHDLEGSYATVEEFASVRHLGRKWLFNDHGHRALEWDDHCNTGYTRWILREHGITLTGPSPRSFMPVVPADLLRREAAAGQDYQRLRDDPERWEQYLAERREWDALA